MLQREPWKFILIIFFFSLSSKVSAVVFLAPGASSTEYHNELLRNNQQTYTQWYLETASQRGAEAQARVLEFSQRALKEGPTKEVLLEWERLRLQLDLNSTDREVLTLLAEKLHQMQELCRYILLDKDLLGILENPESAQNCAQKAIPLPRLLKNQIGDKDLFVIDGVALRPEQLPEKMLGGSYRWRVISNQFKDQSFQGTAYEFSKAPFSREYWVSGDCQNYKLDHPDFSVSVRAKIYFNNNCIVPGLPPEKNFGDWAQEHKVLLWGLGILAAGVAASQLKDKTLVITRP